MILEQEIQPKFRDAGAEGVVGMKGYLAYFQDMQNLFMYRLHKGNDSLPEERDLCWMFTKYHVRMKREAGYTQPLHAQTWVEKIRASAIVQMEMILSGEEGEYAKGSLECILFDKKKGHIAALADADFPVDIQESKVDGGVGFTRIPRRMEGMEPVYIHKVRYSDLDKTRHMTNLKYVDLFLDALESEFYEKHRIIDLELHYVTQCFPGENITVNMLKKDSEIFLAACHEDGSIAAQMKLITEKR